MEKILNYLKINSISKGYKSKSDTHLTAESHVDRFIESPREFVRSNIIGTFIFESSLTYFKELACGNSKDVSKNKWLVKFFKLSIFHTIDRVTINICSYSKFENNM